MYMSPEVLGTAPGGAAPHPTIHARRPRLAIERGVLSTIRGVVTAMWPEGRTPPAIGGGKGWRHVPVRGRTLGFAA
jgi:hypothetical protein